MRKLSDTGSKFIIMLMMISGVFDGIYAIADTDLRPIGPGNHETDTRSIGSAECDTGFRLIRPANGVRIADNTPVLSWQPVDCKQYLVWIDGILIDSVKAPQHWYIPFPMSYGTHRWYLVAKNGELKISSDTLEFTIEDRPLSTVPENATLLRNGWKVISSLYAGPDGSVLSRENLNTGSWHSTSIPATALSVMVRNGLYPDPYTGTNNMKIPDLNDEFNDTYGLLKYSHIENRNPWKEPYWYRREFTIPPGYKDKMIWLTLGEINYRAEVWLNGTLLADTTRVVGMERRFSFEITPEVRPDGPNILAIAIYPPDHPGEPAPPPLTPLADPGTNMADGMISRDYTKWDVLGWDWQPAVRDRDMGITEDVYIHATDAIELDNLYVTSDLPLPDTSYADVTISMDLVNHSGQVKKGKIEALISAENKTVLLEEPFLAGPGDTLHLLWDRKNMPRLHLENPRLWWPNGYGKPALYDLTIHAITGSRDTASRSLKFGIREVDTYIGNKERVYRINGRDIYCKGGNWVLDMTLNWTASRYEHEIMLTRNANLNMLRIWGPTGAPPEVLYDAADRNGILLWQDFLNDFWGTFRNRPGYRPDKSLFEKATISIVKKYRNHPSLIIWGSGNEGPNPREELIMDQILPQYDGRGSRHYLKISNGDGLHGGGPYHTIEPAAYFTHPNLNGFSSEIGPSGVPVYESVMKFMPAPGEIWMPGRFPLDGTWAYHDANDWPGRDRRKFSSYDNIVRKFYGPTDSSSVADVKDYLDKCQLLNYDVYRASIEAINSQLWDNASGILLWKANSSWPSMTWQVYDWYMQTHAGYYGTRKAAAPVTVQFNRESKKVELVNATYRMIGQASVTATLYREDMTEIWNMSVTMDLPESRITVLSDPVPVQDDVCFLRLMALDRQGHVLAENFYWLGADNDFRKLADLPEPELTIISRKNISDDQVVYTFTLSNSGRSVALMTELRLVDSHTGLEILPSFWSDNYISLLPGEKKNVRATIRRNNLPAEINMKYRSFNMEQSGLLQP